VNLVFKDHPENGTSMPKYVVVGNQYEVFYYLFCCILITASCWLKYGKQMDGVYLHLPTFPALSSYDSTTDECVIILFHSAVNGMI
jgi:hypothetical protein